MAAHGARRVVIGAGGSAGDVMPAIALAHALAARGIESTILGGEHGLEARLVPAAGIAFEALCTQPLFGAGPWRSLRIPYALWRGHTQATQRLRSDAPALVIGFGGHASLAPVLAARQHGIPTALYEANARPGIANALLAPLVDRAFTAEAETRWPLAPRALERVGRVLRPELEGTPPRGRTLPRDRPLRILVLSGSQGSRFLNEHASELLAALRAHHLPFELWHQAGLHADLAAVAARYQRLGICARVDGYLPELGAAYAWADFAISAAGAGTIAELSVYALPALWIPIEAVARDHQLPNACAHGRRTGALVCAQREFEPARLARQLAELLSDPRRYEQQVSALADAYLAGGADRLAARCLALAGLQPAREVLPRASRHGWIARSADNDASSESSHKTRPERSAMPRSHRA